jgi:predicted dehydrogenase
MTYKIGLMGCGVIASYGHLPAIMDTEGLTIHALFDPNEQNLRREAHRFAVPHAYTDLDSFFNCGIDAVAICSPAPAHIQNVIDAASYGLPVLCEKPLAMNEAEGRRMIDIMEDHNLMLAVGFCYRFSPCALKIKELIAQDAIGDVRSMRLIYNWDCHGKFYRPDPLNQPDFWIEDPRRRGRMDEGGPMVDCGTHQIDLARWWTGSNITRFQSHAAWVDEYEAPDHVWCHLDHDNGCHTMVEMSYSFGHTTKDRISHFLYEIIGTRGMIRYDRNFCHFELRNEHGTYQLEYHGEKNFHGMYDAFRKALDTGELGDLCSAEDALEVTRIARHATDDVIADRMTSGIW